MPCHWEDHIIESIDDPDLVASIFEFRDQVEEDWLTVSKLLKLYSQHFD